MIESLHYQNELPEQSSSSPKWLVFCFGNLAENGTSTRPENLSFASCANSVNPLGYDVSSASTEPKMRVAVKRKVIGGDSVVMTIARFIDTLYSLSDLDKRARAIDLAIGFLDDYLVEGRLEDCNLTLELLKPERLKTSICVSILGITRKANQLPGRFAFYKNTVKYITREKGRKYAKELLNKYR